MYFVILSFLNFIHMPLLLKSPAHTPTVANVAQNFLRYSLVPRADERCRIWEDLTPSQPSEPSAGSGLAGGTRSACTI